MWHCKKGIKNILGFRPRDIRKQFNIIPSSVVGFYIKRKSLKKVGLLNLKYKIQSDYDLIYRMIVTHNLKGIGKRRKYLVVLEMEAFQQNMAFLNLFLMR